MEISSLLSTNAQAGNSDRAKKKGALTQEDFMNLFVTQMRNQNPLEPLDNYQMATQMAQFNSVEALRELTGSTRNLELYLTSMNNLQLANLVGKNVRSNLKTLQKDPNGTSEGFYQLSRPGKATVEILDSGSNLVRRIEAGKKDTSEQKVLWDGKNQNGAALPDGRYSFRVSAFDEMGQAIEVNAYTAGKVTGVSFEEGIPYLQVGGGKIRFSEILQIF